MDIVSWFTSSLDGVTTLASGSAWLWMPLALTFVAWKTWIYYINAEYISKRLTIVLEIKLPREVRRSPLAMELVLNALYQTGRTTTWFDKYWRGQIRDWFSLEIVSIEGAVHFFIVTTSFYRNFVESYIYAQYPEAEVSEVPDYVNRVSYTKDGRWSMMGMEFKLAKPDPYPIKTYIDYGTDKNLKEEEKIDPITPTTELFGSMKKGEQMWLQIMVRATNYSPNLFFNPPNWQSKGKSEIAKIVKEYKENAKKGGEEKPSMMSFTSGERDVIQALERSVSKLGFDTYIRGIYIAEKEAFQIANFVAMVGVLRQYNSNNLNGFVVTRPTAFDYPWQDYNGIRMSKRKKKMFDAYRLRSAFYPPYKRTPFVLNTEELATIYHFPGGVSGTPTLGRIESKKSEPPANLPM